MALSKRSKVHPTNNNNNNNNITALFWAITLLLVGIPYRRFGETYQSYIKRQSFEYLQSFDVGNGTEGLSRNVCKELTLLAA